MTAAPGWFLFDGIVKFDSTLGTVVDEYRFPPGVFASESPFAPRHEATLVPATAANEDDGYVVTFTTNMIDDCSDCLIFDARNLAAGPVAAVRLPTRISSGTHAWWEPASRCRVPELTERKLTYRTVTRTANASNNLQQY